MTTDTSVLSGAWNFRDVAETVNSYGVSLKPGMLLRSSELTRLDGDGREVLRRFGIFDVADLRSPGEVKRHGVGRVADDVVIHRLPFPDFKPVDPDADADAPHESAFKLLMEDRRSDESVDDAAKRYMVKEYQKFARYKGARQAVHTVIGLLGQGHPVIAHCFAGKDRTGFTVSMTLAAIGVPREAIVADYLRSNDAITQLRERVVENYQARVADGLEPEEMTYPEARLSEEVLGVREEYLHAVRRQVDETYGSLQDYLRAAEVTDADVDRLRAALLE